MGPRAESAVLHNEGTYDEALLLAIALTAYAGEYDQQQALAASFQCHLAKPIEPEALVKAIVALIS